MKYRYDIEQNTPEWYQARLLKFTASHASTIMANGKGLTTLCKEMLCEYYSSNEYEEYSSRYTNANMDRGHEFEDKARVIYELENNCEVRQVGLVEISEHVACSPDGLVGDEGLVEIKNHSDKVFFDLVMTGKIDKKYLDQMQMQLYVTGRKWVDYFAFNPNYSPCFIQIRQYPDMDKFELIKAGLESGTKQLLEMKAELDKKLNKLEVTNV